MENHIFVTMRDDYRSRTTPIRIRSRAILETKTKVAAVGLKD
ncbi:MAG: hypothetical protein WB799_14820 [Candidatus Sulfotelmatobacter sp.]